MADIIIHFKKGTESLATRRISSSVMPVPRIGENVFNEKDNANYSGVVIAVEHRIGRESKETWVVVECK